MEGVTHALYLLWWVQYKHVSPAAVAAILAAGEIVITLLEVPTGWLADRFGHRRSLIGGSIVQVVAMLLCWLAEGVTGLLAASVCVAVGDAFRSGAQEALLYRSCVATGTIGRFQPLVARAHSLTLVALVAFTLAGGAIVRSWGFAAAWIVETAVAAIGLCLALVMVEPPPAAGLETGTIGTDTPSAANMPCGSLHATLRVVMPLIVPSAMLAAAAEASSFLAQVGVERDPTTVTLVVVAITLMEAAGAILSRYLRADRNTQYALLAAGTMLLMTMFLVPSLFLAGVIGLAFTIGLAEPLRTTIIQRTAADHVRAQAASWANAADRTLTTLALLAAGRLPHS